MRLAVAILIMIFSIVIQIAFGNPHIAAIIAIMTAVVIVNEIVK